MMMIPRVRPTYTRAELRAMLFPERDAVARFERELATHFGLKYALVFPYGRSAIYAAFRALGLSGEIVQPAYNCVVVAHATVLSGNRPIFVDSQRDDPNQDVEAMIGAVNEKTVAVVPTSIFGMTFDAPALVSAIRRKNPLAIVLMDCAQAFDTRWKGELIAAQGDAAILAFGIGKAMTTLFGGALLTNRDDVAHALRIWRDRSFRAPSPARALVQLFYFFASWVAVTGIGVNVEDLAERSGLVAARLFKALRSRESIRLPRDNQVLLSDRQAELGRVQLAQLPSFTRRREEISAMYAAALEDSCGVRLPNWEKGATHTIYTLRLDDPSRRLGVLRALRRSGVQGGTVLDYVVSELDCYRSIGIAGDYPNAHQWAGRAVNLPNHPTLTDQQVAHCATALRAALAESES